MRSVVITGATSFIGVHILQECIKNGYAVYAIVRPGSSNMSRIRKESALNLIELEMEDYQKLPKLVNKADIFIHLAWEGARPPFRDDVELQQKNYRCTIMAMNVAVQMRCKVFIGAGSQAEYGKMGDDVAENSQCTPITEYGKKKLMSYETLKEIAYLNKIRFIWTRIFSIYGIFDSPTTLVMSSLMKMKKNQPIELTACTQWWDYLYVADAARAIMMLAERESAAGIYNIASGNKRMLKEFIIEMKDITNSKSELKFGTLQYGLLGPVNLKPDVRKLFATIPWRPEISFREGILRILSGI